MSYGENYSTWLGLHEMKAFQFIRNVFVPFNTQCETQDKVILIMRQTWTYHLCRGCVPGEVVHSRGGQVMLIVLRKLLELVMVMRKAGIHTKIPAGRQRGDKVNMTCHHEEQELIGDSDSPVSAFGQVPRLLRHWLRNVEWRGIVIAWTQSVRVQGNSLLGSSSETKLWNMFDLRTDQMRICTHLSCIFTWGAGGSCDAALQEAAAGWGIAGVRPEVGMEAPAHPETGGVRARQWGAGGVQGSGGWPGLSVEADWHVLGWTQLTWAPG